MPEDVHLAVPANSAPALVGPTGVGKTTLASLIPRFYDVLATVRSSLTGTTSVISP